MLTWDGSLAEELDERGATGVAEDGGGVHFEVCVWKGLRLVESVRRAS